MSQIPDPLAKTVSIPVKIENGEVTCFYGGKLPVIDTIIGQLIVPAYSVKDKSFLEKVSTENKHDFFPMGTVFLVQLFVKNWNMLDLKSINYLKDVRLKYNVQDLCPGYFAEIELTNPLQILLRGTKKAILYSCSCKIPFLNKDAKSINHAYSLISIEFEKDRISHTGNVFQKVYYQESDMKWYPLDNKRNQLEEKYENELNINKLGYLLRSSCHHI